MRAQKWGNSLAVRVPKSVATQIGLKAQDDLDIEVRDGNVVLKPQLRWVYRLDDLLRRSTKKNVHNEDDSEGPVGRESW